MDGRPRRDFQDERTRGHRAGVVKQAARLPASSRGCAREALDIARYVADMTAQLEAMAIAARLDLLAYFLGMAQAEADLFVRTTVDPEGAADERR